MSRVIMYHYVRTFDKEFPYFNFLDFKNFKKQNIFLSKQKKFINIDDDVNNVFYKDNYLLTFDDGFKEHLKVAKYLSKKNILGFFFIPGLQILKKDFLPIHKIHLIFGKFNSNEIIKIFNKFGIDVNFKKDVFSIFKKQKKFLVKSKQHEYENIKIYLKTILNNIDQKDANIVKDIFNYCFTKKKQANIFKKFYLNQEDILHLHQLGMKIGAHSLNHRVLSKLNYKQQKKDINASLKILSGITKAKIKYFCYPYGGFNVFNRNTIKVLKENKVELAFNVESKNWLKKSNKLYIPRYDCNKFKFGKISKIK